MLPLGSNQRPRLYAAALKLLRFALGLDQVRFRTEAEEALGNVMPPLLQLQDGAEPLCGPFASRPPPLCHEVDR